VNGSDDNEGVSGLKVLGVRELTYKMAFLAYHVAPCNAKVRPTIFKNFKMNGILNSVEISSEERTTTWTS